MQSQTRMQFALLAMILGCACAVPTPSRLAEVAVEIQYKLDLILGKLDGIQSQVLCDHEHEAAENEIQNDKAVQPLVPENELTKPVGSDDVKQETLPVEPETLPVEPTPTPEVVVAVPVNELLDEEPLIASGSEGDIGSTEAEEAAAEEVAEAVTEQTEEAGADDVEEAGADEVVAEDDAVVEEVPVNELQQAEPEAEVPTVEAPEVPEPAESAPIAEDVIPTHDTLPVESEDPEAPTADDTQDETLEHDTRPISISLASTVDCTNKPQCLMYCEHGKTKGADGCDICQCNDAPTDADARR